jgi:hypothetical protein
LAIKQYCAVHAYASLLKVFNRWFTRIRAYIMIRKGKEAKPKHANAANAKLNMPISPLFCFSLENDWVI